MSTRPDVSRARAKPLRLAHPEPDPQTADTPPVRNSSGTSEGEEPKPGTKPDISPRVLAALEQPPTPHADFIASGRTAEVRLTDADWRNVCSDCHALLSRTRIGSETFLSCATCRKRGLLQRSAGGGEYVRWVRDARTKGTTE